MDNQFCPAHENVIIHSVKFEEKIDSLISNVTEIKESIKATAKVRMNWWIALSGTFLMIILEAGTTCFYMGQMAKEIEINTLRLNRIEAKIFKVIDEKPIDFNKNGG